MVVPTISARKQSAATSDNSYMDACKSPAIATQIYPPTLRRYVLAQSMQSLIVPARRVGAGWGEAVAEEQLQVIDRILEKTRGYATEDRAIILAIVRHESGFNPRAKNNSSTAHGLFQVIDGTWRGLGFEASQRCETEAQIDAGLALFREHAKRLPLASLIDQPRAVQIYALHHDGPSLAYGGDESAKKKVLPWVSRFKGAIERLNRL
ncbi:MAG: lytic transglycosylase domain-containing protein [Bdellovibrionota bacterium]|nr:MAG: lytic transglycosylase domain-containing protein [Bdellovibrionota bacterium]